MKDSSKYRKLAQRSGIFGIVIWVSVCLAIPSFFGLFNHPIIWDTMRLSGFLLMVLPIPAIVVGLWSFRGLSRKEHSREIGYAVFGIISGLLSIVAIFFILVQLSVHLD